MTKEQQHMDRYEENNVDINKEYHDGGFWGSKNKALMNIESNNNKNNYYNNLVSLLNEASKQVKNYEAANANALDKQKLYENAYENAKVAREKKTEAALALAQAMKKIQNLNF